MTLKHKDIEEIEKELKAQDELVLKITLLISKAALFFSPIWILGSLIRFLFITNTMEFMLNFHCFNFWVYVFTDAIFLRKRIKTKINELAIKEIIE